MKNFKIIHSVLYSCCLILGMVFFIFTPKNNISVAEKRKLSSIPAYSWKGILDGSIMKKYEFYIDDHFPFRGSLIDLAFVLNEKKGFQGKNNVRFITNTNNNSSNNEKNIDLNKAALDINYLANAESTSSKGLLIIAGRCFQVFGGSKGVVKTYIDMIQEYRDLLPANVRIFNCIVPTSSSFNFVKEYDYLRDNEFKNIDVAYSMSKAGIINVKAKEALVNHQNEYLYFATDHHWTGLGAYYAYTAFCASAGLIPMPLSKMTYKVKNNFLGTLYHKTKDKSLKDNVDSVVYFISPVTTQPKILAEFATGVNSYGVFLGGDIPHQVFKTSVKNGKSVLIIKNSFGNPFATYLINNYETVHVVDYRYYNEGVLKLIKNENINDIIFFHNVFSANTMSHTQRQSIIKNAIKEGVKPEQKPIIKKPAKLPTVNKTKENDDSQIKEQDSIN